MVHLERCSHGRLFDDGCSACRKEGREVGEAAKHFQQWRDNQENTVRGDLRLEVMVYQALFPGRVTDLLVELLS